MEIITDIDRIIKQPVVTTIGSFDGVHKGHLALLSQARSQAEQHRMPLAAITFARHPRLVFNNNCAPFLLTSTDEKLSLLADAGVDICILLPFDKEMASLSAREFMQQILHDKIGAGMLAVGYDHRFGSPRAGEGFNDYVAYGSELGIKVVQMSCYSPDGCNISSSMIRRSLEDGDVSTAASMLGRNYSIKGNVIHGAALGRRLSFPTANISLTEPMQQLPQDGVYECKVSFSGLEHHGVMNIGHKPTLNNQARTIEVFILDFDGDIYGCDIKIEFLRRIRPERRFNSLDELKQQIAADVEEIRKNQVL